MAEKLVLESEEPVYVLLFFIKLNKNDWLDYIFASVNHFLED